jgi:hypothetical protein
MRKAVVTDQRLLVFHVNILMRATAKRAAETELGEIASVATSEGNYGLTTLRELRLEISLRDGSTVRLEASGLPIFNASRFAATLAAATEPSDH